MLSSLNFPYSCNLSPATTCTGGGAVWARQDGISWAEQLELIRVGHALPLPVVGGGTWHGSSPAHSGCPAQHTAQESWGECPSQLVHLCCVLQVEGSQPRPGLCEGGGGGSRQRSQVRAARCALCHAWAFTPSCQPGSMHMHPHISMYPVVSCMHAGSRVSRPAGRGLAQRPLLPVALTGKPGLAAAAGGAQQQALPLHSARTCQICPEATMGCSHGECAVE